MTKNQIIDYILNYDLTSLNQRLDKLLEEEKITAGTRYYVYNPYDVYAHQQLLEMLDKAGKSKNYFRYLKRFDSIHYGVMLKSFKKDIAVIEAFLQEQENLPFDQSQKQVLIQKGELK